MYKSCIDGLNFRFLDDRLTHKIILHLVKHPNRDIAYAFESRIISKSRRGHRRRLALIIGEAQAEPLKDEARVAI